MDTENHSFIQRLDRVLDQSLPGEDAQWKMAVHPRQDRRPEKDTYADAGVLLLLLPGGESYDIVFIQRTEIAGEDRHSGQISFPGGRYEPGDRNTEDTALRETEEEIGVPGADIELLGALTPLFIPVSDFMVHPYVGFISEKPDFIPEESEVKEVLTASLSYLLNPDSLLKKDMILDGEYRLENVPHFDLNGRVLWGATAMMLSEFLELIRNDIKLQGVLDLNNIS